MAVTRSATSIILDNSDATNFVTERLSVKAIVCAAVAGAGGTFVLKDPSGDIMLNATALANTSVVIPFGEYGWWLDGVEFDSGPAGAFVTLVLA